jgi:hypothetical protein
VLFLQQFSPKVGHQKEREAEEYKYKNESGTSFLSY